MDPKLFAIPNLVSAQAKECRPWENCPPKPAIKDHDLWVIDKNTDWFFVSGFEGMSPSNRVVNVGNEAVKIHAIVADYDSKNTAAKKFKVEDVRERCANAAVRPTLFHMTKSGGARVVWLFQAPISTWREFSAAFLKVAETKLGLKQLIKGFDSGAYHDVCKYYEWTESEMVSGVPLPSCQVEAWAMEASVSSGRKGETVKDLGLTIDEVGKIAQEQVVQGRWRHPQPPPTNFSEGARCRRFWDADATDDTAAVIMSWGVYHFSDGLGGKTWVQLLGREAITGMSDESIGEATKGIYFEGGKNRYWIALNHGRKIWNTVTADVLRRTLNIERGVSKLVPKDEESSRVDRVMQYVESSKAIEGTVCEVFNAREVIYQDYDGGKRWLNTSTVKALQPDPRSLQEIEADSSFQWFYTDLLGNMFPQGFGGPDRHPDFVRQHFLAWLRRFYVGAQTLNLRSGQASYLVGKPGTGKSLLLRIASTLVGGHNSGALVLSDATSFNAHLFQKALVTVDDEIDVSDGKQIKAFVQKLKAFVANPDHSCHGKGATQVQVEWRGRWLISANGDAVSAGVIPDLKAGAGDKINLYQVAESSQPESISDEYRTAVSRMIAKWLLETQDPEWLVLDRRFGITSYHDADLEDKASESQPGNELLDLLDEIWRLAGVPEARRVDRFTAPKLYQFLADGYKDTPGMVKFWSIARVSTYLKFLQDTHPEHVVRTSKKTDGRATWTIDLVKFGRAGQ